MAAPVNFAMLDCPDSMRASYFGGWFSCGFSESRKHELAGLRIIVSRTDDSLRYAMNERSNRIVNSLLDRAEQMASASDWRAVDQICDEILAIDPGNAEAETFKRAARSINTAEPPASFQPQIHEPVPAYAPAAASTPWREPRKAPPAFATTDSWFTDHEDPAQVSSDTTNFLLFRGKIGRLQLLGVWMISNLVVWPVSAWLNSITVDEETQALNGSPALLVVLVLMIIALLWVELGGTACRFRDIGKSGWWALTLLIPLINVGVIIYILLTPGQTRTRRRNSITGSN